MKKLACFIFSVLIMLSACTPAFASSSVTISLDSNTILTETPTKYGINLDGIPSSNLVENGSFEDSANGWQFPSTEYTYGTDEAISKNNKTYCVINSSKSYILKNKCYDGASFIKDNKYEFSFFVKNIDFEGAIRVWLDGDKNKNEITQLSTSGISKNSWTKFSAELTAIESEIGGLAIEFDGDGSLEVDFVSLVNKNSYGYNDDGWKGLGIREDVWSAIQNVKPAFFNFSLNNPVWKNSIGAVQERENSELGYHEYLQLCSDLNAIAIPTLNTNIYKTNSSKFKNYKQDILDLIEYANADWQTSYYGSLRAANGSTEPFNLKYIQLIGDGERYYQIKKAIESKYSDITILGKKDISVIENEKRDMGAALENTKNTLKSCDFVMYGNTFDDLIKIAPNEISYSTTYLTQMLLSNNQGTHLLDANQMAENVESLSEVTIDKTKNSIFISTVNSSSAIDTVIDISALEDVTSASIQYINDGYLSSYNDIGKRYVAPVEKKLEIDYENKSINAKIPENSISVIRITYNNANDDALFSIPNELNDKAKNFVPPVIIAIIISLAVALPLGTAIGFVLYRNVISKNKKEKKNE